MKEKRTSTLNMKLCKFEDRMFLPKIINLFSQNYTHLQVKSILPLRGGCRRMQWLHWPSHAGSFQCKQRTSYGILGLLCLLVGLCSGLVQPETSIGIVKAQK